MKRKPASRRPKTAKKAPPKKHVVGIALTARPTREQLAALKKAFGTKMLASIGVAPSDAISNKTVSLRKRRR